MNWIYNQAPTLLLAPILLLLLFSCQSLGSILRRKHMGPGPAGEEERSGEGMILSAVLGLLALLMGFTFSLAIDRFDVRRSLVLQESNAIGTTYLRAQLLDEPHRSTISRLLVVYADLRLALARENRAQQQGALLRRSDELQHRLWSETTAAIRPIRHLEISSSFLETTNQMIDLAAERTAARRAHVPNRVLTVLVIYMAIAALILGYVMSGARARWATSVLLALLAMSFLLIRDIDRPNSGGIREPQQAMQDLVASLRAMPPASFVR